MSDEKQDILAVDYREELGKDFGLGVLGYLLIIAILYSVSNTLVIISDLTDNLIISAIFYIFAAIPLFIVLFLIWSLFRVVKIGIKRHREEKKHLDNSPINTLTINSSQIIEEKNKEVYTELLLNNTDGSLIRLLVKGNLIQSKMVKCQVYKDLNSIRILEFS